MYHAWYSAKAAINFGAVKYERANGEVVVATAVDKSKNFEDSYKWDDKIYLGIVEKYHSDFITVEKYDDIDF
jgi:hypothetical protein